MGGTAVPGKILEHVSFLKHLISIKSTRETAKVLQEASDEQLAAILQIALNIYIGNIKATSKGQRQEMLRNQNFLKHLLWWTDIGDKRKLLESHPMIAKQVLRYSLQHE